MTVDVRHARVSGLPASGDPSLMQGTDWDANHVLRNGPASLLGRADSATGQAATQEIALDVLTMGFVAGQLSCLITWSSLPGKPASFPYATPIPQTDVATLVGDLAAKAPLNSPALLGVPTAPTPAGAHTNDSTIPTTAWVQTVLAGAIAGGGPPTGGASGDLAGSYPGPSLKWISRTASQTLAIGTGGTLGSAAFTPATAFLGATAAAGGDLAGNYPNPTINPTVLAPYALNASLANYLPLAGGTLTGDLTVAHGGGVNAGIAVNQNDATGFRPFIALQKQGTTILQVSADGAGGGAFYEATTYHQFFAGGTAVATMVSTGVQLAGNPTAPTQAAADEDTSIATTAFVKTHGATATNGVFKIGASTPITVINTWVNGPTTGAIGAAGQVWMLSAACFADEPTGSTLDFFNFRIWNGTAAVASATLPVQGTIPNNCPLNTVVTLTGATTFTLQAQNISSARGNLNSDSHIVAMRIA
jgi:hypothetical protein